MWKCGKVSLLTDYQKIQEMIKQGKGQESVDNGKREISPKSYPRYPRPIITHHIFF